jgi:protoheme IX farnesyltransferase
MKSQATAIPTDVAAPPPTLWKDLMTLTKSSITGMCVMMTGAGYLLATPTLKMGSLLLTMLGTMMVVAGSCALNMYMERHNDATMTRTANRPLPAGRLSPAFALTFAWGLTLGGTLLLGFWVNWLTAGLAFLSFFLYVGVYTPMKRRTSLFLAVGTIPGAMPPLLGWTAATGQLELPGLVLFLILLIWQLPHFIALSLMCKDDYERGGIRILSLETNEQFARLQAFWYSILLMLASFLLIPLKVAGPVYFVFALAGGGWMLWHSFKATVFAQIKRSEHKLFFASLVYLPLVTMGLVLDVLLLS